MTGWGAVQSGGRAGAGCLEGLAPRVSSLWVMVLPAVAGGDQCVRCNNKTCVLLRVS